ncbi:MAG: response regulator transcription factor [Nitrosospira sp.]
MKLNPETKVILLIPSLPDEIEWSLFRTGIRGCCRSDVEPELLSTIVESVQRGELWLRRALSWRLLNELIVITQEKNNMKKAISDLLANLTRREGEIATLVRNGDSNKQIARRLDITERTVKAHLTEVFRKLEIAGRLKLTLMVKGSLTHLVSSRIAQQWLIRYVEHESSQCIGFATPCLFGYAISAPDFRKDIPSQNFRTQPAKNLSEKPIGTKDELTFINGLSPHAKELLLDWWLAWGPVAIAVITLLLTAFC